MNKQMGLSKVDFLSLVSFSSFLSGVIPHSLTLILHSWCVPRVLKFIYFSSVGF